MKILIVFLGIISSFAHAQEKLKMQDIENKWKYENKLLLVYFYTNWCGVCQIQSAKINQDFEIKSKLNSKVYWVEFDAESTEEFILEGHKFQKFPNEIHQFAKSLMQESDEYSFPYWVLMNSDWEVLFQHSGLISTEDLNSILKNLPVSN
jgi:thioredoxin-related protein